MSEQATTSITTDSLNEVVNGAKKDYSKLSLESLVLLINTERLKRLNDSSHKELQELKKRQDQVSFLHKLMKSINKTTATDGTLNLANNTDLQQLIQNAKTMGVDLDETKTSYTTEERDRLIENIRMTIEDFNVHNEMQMQTVNRLTNERYESYQMARSILRPLHDSKISIARGIK